MTETLAAARSRPWAATPPGPPPRSWPRSSTWTRSTSRCGPGGPRAGPRPDRAVGRRRADRRQRLRSRGRPGPAGPALPGLPARRRGRRRPLDRAGRARVAERVLATLERGGWFLISDIPFPDTDEGLRSIPGRVMGAIQFFEARSTTSSCYDTLLARHGFTDLGSASLTPMHALTWGRRRSGSGCGPWLRRGGEGLRALHPGRKPGPGGGSGARPRALGQPLISAPRVLPSWRSRRPRRRDHLWLGRPRDC
jgi:hypothetical protein